MNAEYFELGRILRRPFTDEHHQRITGKDRADGHQRTGIGLVFNDVPPVPPGPMHDRVQHLDDEFQVALFGPIRAQPSHQGLTGVRVEPVLRIADPSDLTSPRPRRSSPIHLGHNGSSSLSRRPGKAHENNAAICILRTAFPEGQCVRRA